MGCPTLLHWSHSLHSSSLQLEYSTFSSSLLTLPLTPFGCCYPALFPRPLPRPPPPIKTTTPFPFCTLKGNHRTTTSTPFLILVPPLNSLTSYWSPIFQQPHIPDPQNKNNRNNNHHHNKNTNDIAFILKWVGSRFLQKLQEKGEKKKEN
jgi:hypothetical protein